ncbi:hypothetical protein C8J56DRAFT_953168 [Mycena floridula]|nr:hypothetical protein C8J56DRAFT_953168 [Mycena floridula]
MVFPPAWRLSIQWRIISSGFHAPCLSCSAAVEIEGRLSSLLHSSAAIVLNFAPRDRMRKSQNGGWQNGPFGYGYVTILHAHRPRTTGLSAER